MSADKLLIFGKGFQYSRDGTGNRLVFHLQGCDLRCPWCANPEGMSREPVLLQKASVIPEWVCKNFDRSKCRSCADRTCLKPNGILVLSSREYTVDELCREAVSARRDLKCGSRPQKCRTGARIRGVKSAEVARGPL